MLAAQAIYGPDAHDLWVGNGIALGRNLFQYLPEDVHDAQPLAGEGGRCALVADLRLDNREELAEALGMAFDRLESTSDSAILLSTWERRSEGLFEHLVGDHAFTFGMSMDDV